MTRHLAAVLGALTFWIVPATSLAAGIKMDLIQMQPWAMENPDKASSEKVAGILADVAAELEKRSGITVERRLTPYARVEKELEDGACDLAVMVWTDDRARYANRLADLVSIDFGIRAVKGASVRSYDDLKNVTVSVTRGLKVDPKFDVDASLKKELDLDYTTGVKKASAGRVQAVAGAIDAINKIITQANLSDSFRDTLVLRSAPITAIFSKKSGQAALEPKVKEAFASIVADGTARRIYAKWMK